jgi:aminopeptidase-like protein
VKKIIDIVKDIFPFDYSVAGEGNDKSIKVFNKYLDFKIHSFSTGQMLNGWKIPSAIKVIRGTIADKKKIVLDAKNSPFHLISQCCSFKGEISLRELKKFLFYSSDCPEGIPYHWTQLYRPNEKKWGFCVKKNFIKKLKLKKYNIDIYTKKIKNKMNVLEYEIKGRTNKTIIINAHNCHKFQANDDISGCAVGIKLFSYLKSIPKLNYTYRLLIAPELFGPMFWLKKSIKIKKDIIGAILIKSVGNQNILKLQKSFNGKTYLDKAAKLALNETIKNYEEGSFRTIHGNDETVFESPGYCIPTISFTRFPFREYHTNLDLPDKLSEKMLDQACEVLKKTIHILDNNFFLKSSHKGLLCLSNKKYDLYLPAIAPGIVNQKYSSKKKNWNILMNCLPMECIKGLTILDLCLKYKTNFFECLDYLKKWRDKKLIRFIIQKNLF